MKCKKEKSINIFPFFTSLSALGKDLKSYTKNGILSISLLTLFFLRCKVKTNLLSRKKRGNWPVDLLPTYVEFPQVRTALRQAQCKVVIPAPLGKDMLWRFAGEGRHYLILVGRIFCFWRWQRGFCEFSLPSPIH